MFRRLRWNNNGCKSSVWRCISRLEKTGIDEPCHARTVNELLIEEVVVKAINQTINNKDNLLKQLQKNVAQVVGLADDDSKENIDAKLQKLQHELLKKANSNEDYEAIANEIHRLGELRKQTEVTTVNHKDQIHRIRSLSDFIKRQSDEIVQFDERLVRQLISKITVFDDRFMVEFKSGVSVEIEA